MMAREIPRAMHTTPGLELDTRALQKTSDLEVDSQTLLQFHHKYDYSRPPREPQVQQHIASQPPTNQRGPNFVGGLLIGFLAATLVVSGILGGGLGATLSSCQKKTKILETATNQTSTATVTITVASSNIPTAIGTALLSNYTPISPYLIDTLYNDCDPSKNVTTAFGDTYSPMCGRDINSNVRSAEGGVVGDIVGVVAYSFMDCMTACSSMNNEAKQWGFPTRCRSITFGTNMRNGTRLLSANCWLKNGSLADASLALIVPVKQSAKLITNS